MSSPPRSPGCALRADGTLKDAEEIDFFNDPSDDVPLPSSTSSLASISGTLDSFIRAKGSGTRAKPATMVGGARRSSRAARPSAKVRDSAVSPSTVPAKRPGGPSSAKAPVFKQARVEDDGDNDDEIPDLQEGSDEEDDDDEDEDDDEDDDDPIRVMGERDRKVSVQRLFFCCSLY